MTTYEYLNLIASYGGLALIYYGIRVMANGAEIRAADSERKHTEAMAESRRREEEGLRRHEESMASLRELIEGQVESRWPCANSSSDKIVNASGGAALRERMSVFLALNALKASPILLTRLRGL